MTNTLHNIYQEAKRELLGAVKNHDEDFISSIFKIGDKVAQKILGIGKKINSDNSRLFSDIEDALTAIERSEHHYFIAKALRLHDGFYGQEVSSFSEKLAKAIIHSIKIKEDGTSNSHLKKLHSLLLQLPPDKHLLDALQSMSEDNHETFPSLSGLHSYYKCLAHHQLARSKPTVLWENLLNSDWLANHCPKNMRMRFANTFINAYLSNTFNKKDERVFFDIKALNTQFKRFCQLAIQAQDNFLEQHIELLLIKLVGYFEPYQINFCSRFYENYVSTWQDSVSQIVRNFIKENGLEPAAFTCKKPKALDLISNSTSLLVSDYKVLVNTNPKDRNTRRKVISQIRDYIEVLKEASLDKETSDIIEQVSRNLHTFEDNINGITKEANLRGLR